MCIRDSSRLGVAFTVGAASSVYISNVSLSASPTNGSVMTLKVTISNPTASGFTGTMDANVWDSASGHALTPQNISIAANGSTTPVSYTHLRAHETVLDLVCRLLLEKKK